MKCLLCGQPMYRDEKAQCWTCSNQGKAPNGRIIAHRQYDSGDQCFCQICDKPRENSDWRISGAPASFEAPAPRIKTVR